MLCGMCQRQHYYYYDDDDYYYYYYCRHLRRSSAPSSRAARGALARSNLASKLARSVALDQHRWAIMLSNTANYCHAPRRPGRSDERHQTA